MGIFRQFPYTNFHDINLDWVLNKIRELWKGVDDLDKKMDDFIAETEPTIRDEVDQWLDEHPEATTTVVDGSLTLPKFSDELKEDIILNNEELIHKQKANFINDIKYVPNDHMCNGFTADENYFYIAHHYPDDTTPLFITKVSRSDYTQYETYQTSLTGHGNSLSILYDYLYITDTTGRVDVINKNNPSLIIGNFTPDPVVNGYSIKEIDNKIISTGFIFGNNALNVSQVRDNYSVLICQPIMKGMYNCYTQGLDHTNNCIYVARSYGQMANEYVSNSFIDAYSYSGQLLNRVYIELEYDDDIRDRELEDIYRDSDDDVIYYVTSSGRIGVVQTLGFTTDQTTHKLSGSIAHRLAEYDNVVLTNNESPLVEYTENTLIANKIWKNPYTTIYQGAGIGFGLIAGLNAFFFFRAGQANGIMIGNGDICYGRVDYTYDQTEQVLKYRAGIVDIRNNDGTITRRNLLTWSQENPDKRTIINQFQNMPMTIPFTSANPFIPIGEKKN